MFKETEVSIDHCTPTEQMLASHFVSVYIVNQSLDCHFGHMKLDFAIVQCFNSVTYDAVLEGSSPCRQRGSSSGFGTEPMFQNQWRISNYYLSIGLWQLFLAWVLFHLSKRKHILFPHHSGRVPCCGRSHLWLPVGSSSQLLLSGLNPVDVTEKEQKKQSW